MYSIKSKKVVGSTVAYPRFEYVVVAKEGGYFVARFELEHEAKDHVDWLTAADRVVDRIHRDLSGAALEIGDRNKLAAYVASRITPRDKYGNVLELL